MNYTILIVDDVKINIDMLINILGDDYTTMAAINGESALKLLERRKPDLVLLDVSMPGIDGFEVLSRMKSNKELEDIPVIFVTGEQDEYSEEKGLALGAVDYIKKPYNAAIVGVKVRNHLELKAHRDTLELLVRERTKQLAASHEAIIMGMSLMSESHDKVTGGHIERIKYFTGILARRLSELYPSMLTAGMADQITLFSPLHDVGKIGISDVILKKTGVLTPEEYEIMKMHTLGGGALLRRTELFLTDIKEDGGLKIAIEIAECHHERFDGTGYPNGLKGEEIPLSARIVALADVYDALRSSRSYKKGLTHEKAADIIISGDSKTSPAHFDPKVLEAFSAIHGEFKT